MSSKVWFVIRVAVLTALLVTSLYVLFTRIYG